ncbi:ribonuclease H-like domain-containing protein [Pholiota molesta]|nr:ribonuclease H-like domain-containing protein [Pholiota molesta]
MSSSKGKNVPSSNWLALKKQLKPAKKPTSHGHRGREDGSQKRRKVDGEQKNDRFSRPSITSEQAETPSAGPSAPSATIAPHKNGESIAALQQMVLGHVEYTPQQELSGKYLSLDCEMSGQFYGAVILDEFVRQKERVVDYRTQWSGIRESDMIKAQKFEDVQKRVADLLQDRILVGHAVHNDLKALLLSHPRAQTRDTQICAYKFGVVKSKRPALRNLVHQELGLTIQSGEHSSITDARATMAVYRLHKKEWEKGSRPLPTATSTPTKTSTKRKAMGESDDSDADSDSDGEPTPTSKPAPLPQAKQKAKTTPTEFPGGGRKGVSYGLSTVVRTKAGKSRPSGDAGGRSGGSGSVAANAKTEWWKQLPGALPAGGGSKGSIRVAVQGSS